MKPRLFRNATWHDAREEVESCLRYLLYHELKEWGADRIYIVVSGEGIPSHWSYGGFADREFSIKYRSAIGERFTTHNPGLLIDTDILGAVTDQTFSRFCNIAIHEAGHLLQHRYPVGHFATIPVLRQKARTKRKELIPERGVSTEAGYCPGRRLSHWLDVMGCHQADFVRPLVHLGLRALQHGWPIQFDSLCRSNYYFPGAFGVFEFALDTEVEAFRNRSLNALWDCEPSEKFTMYWAKMMSWRTDWVNETSELLIEWDSQEAKEHGALAAV